MYFRGTQGILCKIWRDRRGNGDEGPDHQTIQVSVGGDGEERERQLTGKHCRGFGFVTFADVGGVDKVLAQNSHDLDGKKVGSVFLVYCHSSPPEGRRVCLPNYLESLARKLENL